VGGRYDLAIALSILAASGQVPGDRLADCEFLGELALSGDIRAVQGALPAVVAARRGGHQVVIPCANQDEAAVVDCGPVHQAGHLLDVVGWLAGQRPLAVCERSTGTVHDSVPVVPEPRIKGQAQAKRALMIAAAGRHNLLFVGPPGTGKTLLAHGLPRLLPPLNEHHALELAAVRSVAREAVCPATWTEPPFRAPHHTASAVALVGGGNSVKPGEISLAHRGVLFLDELPEFSRHVLEVLREPLESGLMTLSRANYRVQFPARFQLVAAMNPCPCGYHGDPRGNCRCSPDRIEAYRHRVSGPLLDRIDLQVAVPRLSRQELLACPDPEESWWDSRRAIEICRDRQLNRAGKLNNELEGQEAEAACALGAPEQALLSAAIERLGLSARAYHRVLKLARTIADLAEERKVTGQHVLEAVSYRSMDSRVAPNS
jgi:magnesium chelatase family protein